MEELQKANETINVLIGGYIFTFFLFYLWIRTLNKYIDEQKEWLKKERDISSANFKGMMQLHTKLMEQQHKIETYDNLFPNE